MSRRSTLLAVALAATLTMSVVPTVSSHGKSYISVAGIDYTLFVLCYGPNLLDELGPGLKDARKETCNDLEMTAIVFGDHSVLRFEAGHLVPDVDGEVTLVAADEIWTLTGLRACQDLDDDGVPCGEWDNVVDACNSVTLGIPEAWDFGIDTYLVLLDPYVPPFSFGPCGDQVSAATKGVVGHS